MGMRGELLGRGVEQLPIKVSGPLQHLQLRRVEHHADRGTEGLGRDVVAADGITFGTDQQTGRGHEGSSG